MKNVVRMKIILVAVSFLFGCAFNTHAQVHYQVMGMFAENFLQHRIDKYDVIPVKWNMEGTIQADLNDGINYILENRPVQAEGSLTIVVNKDATVWQAWYYRAVARKQQGNYAGAIEDLQRTLKLNPKCYEALVEAGRCYLAINSPEEAARYIKRAIQVNKNQASAYFVKGCIDEILGEINPTISFRQCLSIDNRYHPARITIALTSLLINKDEVAAMEEFDTVLKLDSLQPDALAFRSILMYDKDKDQSLRDLNRLIATSPGNMGAYYLRGLLLTALENYDRAFSDFQNVIRSTSTSDNNFQGQQSWVDKKIDIQNVGAYTLTRVYGLSDDDAAKLKQAYCMIVTNSFDKTMEVISTTSSPHEEPLCIYLKAVASEHQGKHSQAMFLYDQAIALDKTIADAYKKRGIYRAELQQWEKAVQDFNTVLRLMPDAYVIYKIRGLTYYHSKNLDKAIADFSQYIARDSSNVEVIGYRGQCYMDNMQPLNAYIDFANSRNTRTFVKHRMLHLVDSVLQKGDTTLALTALKSFTRADQLFTEAWVLQLKLFVAKNNWRALENALAHPFFDDPNLAIVSKQDRAYFLTVKGILMSKTNRHESALSAFSEAMRTDKKYALTYLERGKYLLTQNHTSKAIDDLNKAASLGNEEAKKLIERVATVNE